MRDLIMTYGGQILTLLFGSGGIIMYLFERKSNRAKLDRLLEENKALKISNETASVDKEKKLMDLYQEALDDLKSRYDITIAEIKMDYQKKTEELENEYKAKCNQLEQKYKSMVDVYEDRIAKMQKSFDKRFKNMQARIRELERELESK